MPSSRKQINIRVDDEGEQLLARLVQHYSTASHPATQSWVVMQALRELAAAKGIKTKPAKK